MNDRLSIALRCVEQASALALEHFNNRHTLDIATKSPQDLVSQADLEVEHLIRARLNEYFPDEPVLGEELGGEVIIDGWALDPIDGTGNFLRGSPLWGISLAYLSAGQPVIGVIAYPALEYTLSAKSGEGIWLNGAPFARPEPPQNLRIVGIGSSNNWAAESLGQLELNLRHKGWGLAGYRCATIGLGFAALGQTDGYLERFTNLWDIAAGAVICREAGLLCRIEGKQIPAAMSVAVGSEELMAIFASSRSV
ncbi:inositol monophosphatase family protein [Pseudomonas alliivorans]|uniref:inositol monophosphatase family protein n=1 Tax=Pseudomonas alliivorans TaxID=2810613 RepID=UPI001AE9ED84|nr:inositol monophosphatase family protein [Pseudomonas alliivorans]MBP0942903.1 inositol monophosphatase [Pseudomonas alliivorans]MEE4671861.1 inositol monophosphatase family protein [Pseudomonas alliivorans]MEE4698454.1 inositol monophosphatase family protein [Pseudomonas alliivorans]MEE4880997.1 inositol monophosphatase family protein [Pseudomonas alliivorans]MEE4932385.1 inositol monophosphatase family protein [Pseudomonas alliivorans]